MEANKGRSHAQLWSYEGGPLIDRVLANSQMDFPLNHLPCATEPVVSCLTHNQRRARRLQEQGLTGWVSDRMRAASDCQRPRHGCTVAQLKCMPIDRLPNSSWALHCTREVMLTMRATMLQVGSALGCRAGSAAVTACCGNRPLLYPVLPAALLHPQPAAAQAFVTFGVREREEQCMLAAAYRQGWAMVAVGQSLSVERSVSGQLSGGGGQQLTGMGLCQPVREWGQSASKLGEKATNTASGSGENQHGWMQGARWERQRGS